MAVTGKSAQDGLNLVCGSDHRNFLTVFTHPICIHIYHRWGDVLSVRTKPSFLKTVFSSKKNRWSHTNDYKYLFYKYVLQNILKKFQIWISSYKAGHKIHYFGPRNV